MRHDLLQQRRSSPKHEDPHRIAMEEIGEGEVLVIEARNNRRAAVMGDLLAARMAVQGAAGVVTDGCVRDLPAVREVGLPVFAAGAHAATFPTEHIALEVNVPVACDDSLVMPGDLIVGDEEGVAVVPGAIAMEVAQACRDQEDLDEFSLQKIRDGVPLRDAYPLNDELRREFEAGRS